MHTTQNPDHLRTAIAADGRNLVDVLASFTLWSTPDTGGLQPRDVTVTHEQADGADLFVVRDDAVEVEAFPPHHASGAALAMAHALRFCGWDAILA